jgi:hypothetical protein
MTDTRHRHGSQPSAHTPAVPAYAQPGWCGWHTAAGQRAREPRSGGTWASRAQPATATHVHMHSCLASTATGAAAGRRCDMPAEHQSVWLWPRANVGPRDHAEARAQGYAAPPHSQRYRRPAPRWLPRKQDKCRPAPRARASRWHTLCQARGASRWALLHGTRPSEQAQQASNIKSKHTHMRGVPGVSACQRNAPRASQALLCLKERQGNVGTRRAVCKGVPCAARTHTTTKHCPLQGWPSAACCGQCALQLMTQQ